MIMLEFIVSNLLMLSKCLSFSDISKDVEWLNIYTKDGRVLMSAGEKVRVVVDTAIEIENEIDICVDCRRFIEYINYIKGFGQEGRCSLVLQDASLQIIDQDNDKVKNNLYLEYMDISTTKIRAKNFNRLSIVNPNIMRDGMSFVAVAADGSEKYSSQLPSVLIKVEDSKLLLAGTDSVKCCIYRTDTETQGNEEVVIPSTTARSIASVASLLNKDADIGYSSTYFRCGFGNVAVYSSIINTGFPSLASLLNITSQNIQVDCKNFVNILRGANVATKGKQDQRLSVAVSGGIIRVYSIGFDASLVLDTNIEGDKEEMSFNSSFLYGLCSLFKDKDLILQFSKQVLKITNEKENKVAFLATLR